MKKGIGVVIGVVTLLLFAGRMVLMKNSNERNKYQQELSDEIRYRALQDANKGEFMGSEKGTQLLKESYERKQNAQLQPNPSSNTSKTIPQQKELTAIVNLDVLVQEKFAPMTVRDTEANFNPKTNEVSIIFAATLPGGKKIVGSTYLIGSMEKKKEKHYFKPLKWKKEHGESNSINEYLLTNIDYIDSNGKLKSGNLKAYWDWGLNGKKPFFFEEE